MSSVQHALQSAYDPSNICMCTVKFSDSSENLQFANVYIVDDGYDSTGLVDYL